MKKLCELEQKEHYHFHPSGIPTPSSEDIKVTERLVKAGNIMNIPVLDHIIIGE
jgi:DNA repair protein RadC